MPKRIGGIYAATVIAITVASACGGSVTTIEAGPSVSGGSNTGGTSFGGPVGQPASGGSTPVAPGGSGPISSGGSEGVVCATGLEATGCPANYDDALASVDCVHDAVDSPRFGVCGTLRTFQFGHDGSTMCSYDLNSGMLLGGLSCGHSARCPCVSGGADPTVHCPDPGELACPAVPLGEAGAGGSAGEGGATGATR